MNIFVVFCFIVVVVNAQSQQQLIKLVLPGQTDHGDKTKHCFAEPNTVKDSDLGTFKSTDTCCMAHNKCAKLGSSKLYSCECEETFRKCLRDNKPSVGESIFRTKLGKNYFNVVYPSCTQQGASSICSSKITNVNGDQTRCGAYTIASGSNYLTLDNKFYETM